MKTIKTGLILLVALLAITSCQKGGVFCYRPDGEVVRQDRGLSGFNKVSLCMAADVYIEYGEIHKVEVETSENLHEIIETKISGTTLEIDLKKRKCISGNPEIKVYITMPALKDLSISGGGDIFVLNEMVGESLEINVSGSGDIEMDSLNYNQIDTKISGSGDVYLNALDTVESHDIKISGSGKIEAFQAVTRNVDINVSGSGECEVNVLDHLDVNVSGSGDVIYQGTPEIDQNISGSGSVRPF